MGVKRAGKNVGKWRAPAPMMRKFRERGAWRWKAAGHIRVLGARSRRFEGEGRERAE